jgi:hypothetical protein
MGAAAVILGRAADEYVDSRGRRFSTEERPGLLRVLSSDRGKVGDASAEVDADIEEYSDLEPVVDAVLGAESK